MSKCELHIFISKKTDYLRISISRTFFSYFIYKRKLSFFSGAKWEWASHALTGSNGSNSSNEWHIYDMEVQTVIEEAWALGEQTIDIGNHFPGCPYIINFCNLTQVRRTTGVARPIRRQPCASYPMVKLTAAEIASMLHRKEERRQEFAAEVEKRIKEIKNKKHIKAKKAVKHLMNHLFHPAKKPLNR